MEIGEPEVLTVHHNHNNGELSRLWQRFCFEMKNLWKPWVVSTSSFSAAEDPTTIDGAAAAAATAAATTANTLSKFSLLTIGEKNPGLCLSIIMIMLWKITICAVCLGTVLYGHFILHARFYFAYFSHWTVLASCLYAYGSFYSSVILQQTTCRHLYHHQYYRREKNGFEQDADDDSVVMVDVDEGEFVARRPSLTTHTVEQNDDDDDDKDDGSGGGGSTTAITTTTTIVSVADRVVWILYEIATHSGVAARAGFWTSIPFVGLRGIPLDFHNLAAHGIILCFLLLDGTVVANAERKRSNILAYRWSHWVYFILPWDCLYMLWTWGACVGDGWWQQHW